MPNLILTHEFTDNGSHRIVAIDGCKRWAGLYASYTGIAQLALECGLVCAVTEPYNGALPEFWVINPDPLASPFRVLDQDSDMTTLDGIIAERLHVQVTTGE